MSRPSGGASCPSAQQQQQQQQQSRLSGEELRRLSSQVELTHELLLQDMLMLMRRCETGCGDAWMV